MSRNEPYILKVEEGQRAALCTCGRSETLPLCDGAHKGTGAAPDVVVFEKSGNVAICGCGKSGRSPYCDGSHNAG